MLKYIIFFIFFHFNIANSVYKKHNLLKIPISLLSSTNTNSNSTSVFSTTLSNFESLSPSNCTSTPSYSSSTSIPSSTSTNITLDSDRYSRQLMVYGIEAQEKVLKSHVLLVTYEDSGLSNEILKNLALSGVGNIDILILKTSKKINYYNRKNNKKSLIGRFLTLKEYLNDLNPLCNVNIINYFITFEQNSSLSTLENDENDDEIQLNNNLNMKYNEKQSKIINIYKSNLLQQDISKILSSKKYSSVILSLPPSTLIEELIQENQINKRNSRRIKEIRKNFNKINKNFYHECNKENDVETNNIIEKLKNIFIRQSKFKKINKNIRNKIINNKFLLNYDEFLSFFSILHKTSLYWNEEARKRNISFSLVSTDGYTGYLFNDFKETLVEDEDGEEYSEVINFFLFSFYIFFILLKLIIFRFLCPQFI